jgi:hypothetical protein
LPFWEPTASERIFYLLRWDLHCFDHLKNVGTFYKLRKGYTRTGHWMKWHFSKKSSGNSELVTCSRRTWKSNGNQYKCHSGTDRETSILGSTKTEQPSVNNEVFSGQRTQFGKLMQKGALHQENPRTSEDPGRAVKPQNLYPKRFVCLYATPIFMGGIWGVHCV